MLKTLHASEIPLTASSWSECVTSLSFKTHVSARVSRWKCTTRQQTRRRGRVWMSKCSNRVVFVHAQRRWHKDKRLLKGVGCQKKETMAHYTCHTVITQTVKGSPYHFFNFYSPFHQMYVKCHYKALILARKSAQPFIITAHLNSFSSRAAFFSFSLFLQRKEVSEKNKKNKEITAMLGIYLTSYETKPFFFFFF